MNKLPRLNAPTTLQEAGISPDLLMRLCLKTLYSAGELSGYEMARRLGLLFHILEAPLEFLRVQRHCEVVAGAMVGASSYRYRITTEGRAVAGSFLDQDRYIGQAPVPIAQYRTYMAEVQKVTQSHINRDTVRDAFSHLVLADNVLDEIGAAVRGGRSMFIYGPPGNGKTVIATGVQKLLMGDIAIPFAIEVENSIIRVFDPVNHEEHRPGPQADDRLEVQPAPTDDRWTMCKRPLVKVGGELQLESLDLTFDPRVGYYRAPLQVIANGGVLIIDDFGRQRSTPADLLNRWMVPLESSEDYLTLQSGQKFEVPFIPFVAFATNLRPQELVDEAFLRRVPFKVFAENPTRPAFVQMFDRFCASNNATADPGLPEYLLDGYYKKHGIAARGCHPRDLITQALLTTEYRGVARHLTRDLLDTVCDQYFVHERA